MNKYIVGPGTQTTLLEMATEIVNLLEDNDFYPVPKVLWDKTAIALDEAKEYLNCLKQPQED